jgi:hypothetical protein
MVMARARLSNGASLRQQQAWDWDTARARHFIANPASAAHIAFVCGALCALPL